MRRDDSAVRLSRVKTPCPLLSTFCHRGSTLSRARRRGSDAVLKRADLRQTTCSRDAFRRPRRGSDKKSRGV